MTGYTALLCPGQGAHSTSMLDDVLELPGATTARAAMRNVLGEDLVTVLVADPERIAENELASLATVLVSHLRFLQLLRRGFAFDCTAGYSVGQWSAMHFAGMLEFEQLAAIVHARAVMMSECVAHPCGMLAVIGTRLATIDDLVARVRSDTGASLSISSYNCVGQYTIAGELAAIEAAERALNEADPAWRPKKLQRLAVSGAWHTPLLRDAAARFRRFLDGERLAPPRVPVIDNTNGGFLPAEDDSLRDRLALQIAEPVRWDCGVETLIEHGVTRFVEVGHGRVLTNFGFFLARDATHEAFEDLDCEALDGDESGNPIVASYSARWQEYDTELGTDTCWNRAASRFRKGLQPRDVERTILDIGSGTGMALLDLRQAAGTRRATGPRGGRRFVGVDPAAAAVAAARSRSTVDDVAFDVGSFESVPMESHAVDFAYSIFAFHWVRDPDRAVAELRRVLRPGGRARILFAGRDTGHEFIEATTPILRRHLGLAELLRSAKLRQRLDRAASEQLFRTAFPEVTVEEAHRTYYDSVEGHLRWWSRIAGHFAALDAAARDRCIDEVRAALGELATKRGVPYTIHEIVVAVG